MTLWKPETIYVDEGSLDLPLTRRILAGLDGAPVVEIRDAEEIVSKGRWISDPISAGKKELFLTRRKGPFVKPCPCTPGHVRCGYFVQSCHTPNFSTTNHNHHFKNP